MPIGATMAGQTGVNQAKHVEQLCAGPECASNARDGRTLVHGQGRRHVEHFVHVRLGRLGHSPARVCGEGFQVTTGAFGIEHAECQRAFARAGDSGNSRDSVQGHVHIDVFQIVHSCSTYYNLVRSFRLIFHSWHNLILVFCRSQK